MNPNNAELDAIANGADANADDRIAAGEGGEVNECGTHKWFDGTYLCPTCHPDRVVSIIADLKASREQAEESADDYMKKLRIATEALGYYSQMALEMSYETGGVKYHFSGEKARAALEKLK